jgi:hypothetical protein
MRAPTDVTLSRRGQGEEVQGVALDTLLLEKMIDDLGQMVERVPKALSRGRLAMSESGKVGRERVESVGQARHQIAKHDRRRGESVQQYQGRVPPATGLSVEDAQPVDGRRLVADGRGIIWIPRLRMSGRLGRTPFLSLPDGGPGFRPECMSILTSLFRPGV